MSGYRSDKCSEEELLIHKYNVLAWLDNNFPKWKEKFKLKAFRGYNGDVRLYDGTYQEFPNQKESFRRTEPNKDENGKIIGWYGTRGIHETSYANYISINRDEFDDIKKALEEKEKNSSYMFFDDLIFRHLACG